MEHSISKTDVNNSSRRRNGSSLDLVDRISTLPDSILGIILSFIPTKNAVATSVLSKRWKLVWTGVHNLDLCYDDSMGKQDERDDMRFVEFVNGVFHLHDVGWLNKFCLVWTHRCISAHATSWINTAISKNVHELFLRLETHNLVLTHYPYINRVSPEPFVMPQCVFTCGTLRYLELDGGISVSTDIMVCLPKLETMKLSSVYFQSEEAFEKLIRGCPVLINLFIIWPDQMLIEFHQDDDFRYIISSTSLRRLVLSIEYRPYELVWIKLELEASSLEHLKIEGFVPVFLVQKSLSSLVEAKLDIQFGDSYFSDADMCNSVVEAVRMFHCAKALILSADVIWALCFATISLSTKFERLVRLDADTYCCACSAVRDFIECSDNLQVLTMYQDPTILEKDDHDHDHKSWTPPFQVARSLSNYLKKVVLDGYYGREDEREMIRYILKHGNVREVMQISCHRVKNRRKFELVQEICEFERKSPACKVKFLGWT